MRRPISVLLLCATVLPPTGVAAQAHPDSARAGARASAATETAPGAVVPQTTLRMRGTISAYDAATGVLSIATGSGPVQFPLAPTVRIERAGHKVNPLELKQLSGYHAAVRYSESGGHKTVESVNVYEKSGRIER